MNELKIVKTLDCSGMSCPMPVIKTKKAIDEMEVGEILEMISTDPGAPPDMEAWTKQTQHDLLESHHEDEKFRFLIRKTH